MLCGVVSVVCFLAMLRVLFSSDCLVVVVVVVVIVPKHCPIVYNYVSLSVSVSLSLSLCLSISISDFHVDRND